VIDSTSFQNSTSYLRVQTSDFRQQTTDNRQLITDTKKPLFRTFLKRGFKLADIIYKASETTSVTSGTIRLSKFSIPDFKVIVEDGHPLHDPLNSTVTIPYLNDF
jgi:hypothetical protein